MAGSSAEPFAADEAGRASGDALRRSKSRGRSTGDALMPGVAGLPSLIDAFWSGDDERRKVVQHEFDFINDGKLVHSYFTSVSCAVLVQRSPHGRKPSSLNRVVRKHLFVWLDRRGGSCDGQRDFVLGHVDLVVAVRDDDSALNSRPHGWSSRASTASRGSRPMRGTLMPWNTHHAQIAEGCSRGFADRGRIRTGIAAGQDRSAAENRVPIAGIPRRGAVSQAVNNSPRP
jgi:hypothetical protein